MDESVVREIVDELISSLEPLEAQSTALLQFVKDKGMASDEALAPYLEQAANASDVRWRAFRLRVLSLISSAMKTPEKEQNEEPKLKEKEPSKETSAPGQENVNSASDESPRSKPETSSIERAERANPQDQTKAKEEGQNPQKAKTPERKDAA